jgi:phage protein D
MARANRNEPLLPSFSVRINGQPLTAEVQAWIVAVSVEDDIDIPSMFVLELISAETADGSAPWTDDADWFVVGNAVEVSMGYGDDQAPLITGELTSLEPVFSVDAPPTLLVRGFDKRHRLAQARRTRSFVQQKDSDVAVQIGSEAKVSVQAEDSGVTHPYLLQANQTDLAFLLERARHIRYELAVEGETVLFRPVANAASEALTLSLADDLLEFRPRLSLALATELTVQGWDPKEKQPWSAVAKAGDEVSTMGGQKSGPQVLDEAFGGVAEVLTRYPVASQAEADAMARAHFNAAALDFVRGEGCCRGCTDLRAGTVIRIDDLGARFSGQYYVTSALHRYSRREGYFTDFTAKRNAS